VSLAALIIAKAAGAITIVTSSSDAKLARVKSMYGAHHTINYKTHPDWAAEVMRLTNGHGADHIIEIGGTGTILQSVQAVARGGVVSGIGFLSAPAPNSDALYEVINTVMLKAATVRGVLGASKQQIEEVVNHMGAAGLQMPIDKTFPFNRDSVVEALEYVAAGNHIGKVCISFP
jgi:NADPH:quinone reductase-like Zn-dependent oxidoreductase